MSKQDAQIAVEHLVAFHREFDHCFSRSEMRDWSRFYLCGQLSIAERKTIEPMVLELSGVKPNLIRGLQHFIGQSQWYASDVCDTLQRLVGEYLGEDDSPSNGPLRRFDVGREWISKTGQAFSGSCPPILWTPREGGELSAWHLRWLYQSQRLCLS